MMSKIFGLCMICSYYFVVPENIHTSPTEGIFFSTSPPLWKFWLSFIRFFTYLGLIEPPTPKESPIPSVGGVWIFSGTAHYKNKEMRGKELLENRFRTFVQFQLLHMRVVHCHYIEDDGFKWETFEIHFNTLF